MHFILALLYLISSPQILHASNTEEIKYVDLKNQEPDTVLIIKDKDQNECRLFTHSYILKDSKYLRANHKLESIQVTSNEKFKKILDFIYSDFLYFESFDEFIYILFMQERFEFDKLNDLFLRFINNNLETFKAQELVTILKFMLRTHIPLAKDVRESILKHIASHQYKLNNAHRSELIKYIGKDTHILKSIDDAILELKDPLAAKSATLPVFEDIIRNRARKINNKYKKGENIFYVSSSLEETEQVMILLVRRYNITSILKNPKGLKNKYRLKIISKSARTIPVIPCSPWGTFI